MAAQQQQQQQAEDDMNLNIGGQWLATPTQVNFEQQTIAYEPAKMPGKPKVVSVAETFAAPVQTGVVS